MLKIRDLINRFKQVADLHPNINYFGVGKISDIEDDISYPYLWVDSEPTHTVTFSEDNGYRAVEYVFIFRVADQINDQTGYDGIRGIGKNNELDIVSDSFNTVLDIVNTISEDSLGLFGDINLIDDISVEPFYNEDNGDVSGVQAELTFKVKNDKVCISPLTDGQ